MEEYGLTPKEAKEIKEISNPKELINKKVSLGWDGKNLTVRLPREVANFFGITKKNRFEKTIIFRIKETPKGNMEKSFDVIKRDKPKRKHVKKKKTTDKKLKDNHS